MPVWGNLYTRERVKHVWINIVSHGCLRGKDLSQWSVRTDRSDLRHHSEVEKLMNCLRMPPGDAPWPVKQNPLFKQSSHRIKLPWWKLFPVDFSVVRVPVLSSSFPHGSLHDLELWDFPSDCWRSRWWLCEVWVVAGGTARRGELCSGHPNTMETPASLSLLDFSKLTCFKPCTLPVCQSRAFPREVGEPLPLWFLWAHVKHVSRLRRLLETFYLLLWPGFLWAHGLRRHTARPRWMGFEPQAWRSWSHWVWCKKAASRQEVVWGYKPEDSSLSDLLPAAKLHLLQASYQFKPAPPAGTSSHTWACGCCFVVKHSEDMIDTGKSKQCGSVEGSQSGCPVSWSPSLNWLRSFWKSLSLSSLQVTLQPEHWAWLALLKQ